MSRNNFDIRAILDIPRWEALQDQLAKITNTAIVTVDYKGIPITKHSGCTEFCSVIRQNPVSRRRCYKCDSLAGLEAVRLNRPFIYLCHCGIVDVAVPVTVGDSYLGAVMFGQIRLLRDDTSDGVERLVNEISNYQSDSDGTTQDLRALYSLLPEMDYSRIEDIADLIQATVKYIVDRAIDNRAELMSYEWQLSRQNTDIDIPVHIEALNPSRLVRSSTETVSKSSPVFPATVYVDEHIGEMISMSQMAELCHLSRSYFSRVFLRDAGENFTDYVNRKKITQAKNLLKSGTLSVAQIAGELGYSDVSYFVKLFKRFEGVTPLSYRKLCAESLK